MAEGAVRSMLVVVDPPRFDPLPGFVDGREFTDVQTLIPKPAIERLAQTNVR
jgi:hypothetical protein